MTSSRVLTNGCSKKPNYFAFATLICTWSLLFGNFLVKFQQLENADAVSSSSILSETPLANESPTIIREGVQQNPTLWRPIGRWSRPAPEYDSKEFDGLLLEPFDSIYRYGTWDDSPIVLSQFKLVFFASPKVGCTGELSCNLVKHTSPTRKRRGRSSFSLVPLNTHTTLAVFKQLFRRMMGKADWQKHNGTLPHAPGANGLFYLYNFSPKDANRIMTDPTWTRAIVVRDPRERLLSAYMDKATRRYGLYLQNHCCKTVNSEQLRTMLHCQQYSFGFRTKERRPLVTMSEFVRDIMPACDDVHWRPQRFRMQPKYWPYINFVGKFDNVAVDTKRLLERVGAWQEYGASGWGTSNQSVFGATETVHHVTNSSSQVQLLREPEIKEAVDRLVENDYSCPLLQLHNNNQNRGHK